MVAHNRTVFWGELGKMHVCFCGFNVYPESSIDCMCVLMLASLLILFGIINV